jgi:hypothetical protein
MGPDGAIWALTDSAITNTVSSRLIRIAPTGK